MFSVIDDVFGTNLFQNGYLDVFMFTIEDLYNLIEREANKLDTDALIAELESRGYVVKEEGEEYDKKRDCRKMWSQSRWSYL